MIDYDAIVVGSGFGGGVIAHSLVESGARVLMLERGDWVARGPHNWEADGSLDLTPYSSKETPYRLVRESDGRRRGRLGGPIGRLFNKGDSRIVGGYYCVGGPSVFYGAVSFRMRERDFDPDPDLAGDSGARWPFGYDELEPWYTRAERMLGVAGEVAGDPTQPPRSASYPGTLGELSETSRRIGDAAERIGLNPFRLPLAIHYEDDGERDACVACTTCDTFACAIEAKNDVATVLIRPLIERGLELRPRAVVHRLREEGGRIRAVEGVDRDSGEPFAYSAERVFLAAGAIGSAHLVLASGLRERSSAPDAVGAYLTRHCNGIAFGLFPDRVDPKGEFHKQLGIHDFYFGHPAATGPRGKLGGIQQVQSPPAGLIEHHLPPVIGPLLARAVVPRTTGLLVMAEDQPRSENRLDLEGPADRFGLPGARIRHRHTERDLEARSALFDQAERILREAGAVWIYRHEIDTFSHAAGTLRMGEDPSSAPLDPGCRFRGVDNLWVVDASALPSSGGVNPSLTIAANALRVGEELS